MLYIILLKPCVWFFRSISFKEANAQIFNSNGCDFEFTEEMNYLGRLINNTLNDGTDMCNQWKKTEYGRKCIYQKRSCCSEHIAQWYTVDLGGTVFM